jgi:hypothetical protein
MKSDFKKNKKLIISSRNMTKIFTYIISAITVFFSLIQLLSLISSSLFQQSIQPPGSDDHTIITTLAILTKNGAIPFIDFLQEYAPGFHYVTALMMKIFGEGTAGIILGVLFLQYVFVPIILIFLSYIIFRKIFLSLITLFIYCGIFPWVGIKGFFFLVVVLIILIGDPKTYKFHFKAGLAIGLLMLFTQEFSLYVGYGFFFYTWICSDWNNEKLIFKEKFLLFLKLGITSLFGFLVITIPVLIFYIFKNGGGGFYDLLLYMFDIALGAQASFMKLPFCFDCDTLKYYIKLRYYLTPLVPLVACMFLVCLPKDRYWMNISLITLVSTTTLITAFGRSTTSNISLGGLLDIVLIVFMIFNFGKLKKIPDFTTVVLIFFCFVLEFLIIKNSEIFSFLQLAIVPILSFVLIRKNFSKIKNTNFTY